MNLQTLILGLIIGFVIAIIFMLLFNPRRKQQQALVDELNTTKAALESQQKELASHFSDSAELLDKMAQDFRNLYQHMAKNSEAILNKKRLPIIDEKVQDNPEQLTHNQLENNVQTTDDRIVDEIKEAPVESDETNEIDATLHENMPAEELTIDESHESEDTLTEAEEVLGEEKSDEVHPEDIAKEIANKQK